MTKIRLAALAAIISVTGTAALAQQASVTLDGKAVTVKYTPSALKGRKIFGAVVPNNQVWKIGDAAAPVLHTDADIVFKSLSVPAGKYSLYVLAGAEKWQLIINKGTGAGAYDPKQDVGRITMTMAKPPAPVETSKLTLTKVAAMAGRLEISWENVVASAQFHLDRASGDSEW